MIMKYCHAQIRMKSSQFVGEFGKIVLVFVFTCWFLSCCVVFVMRSFRFALQVYTKSACRPLTTIQSTLL